MYLTKEVREHGVPYAQLDRWERNHQLSVVREHVREIREKIFELSCQLQRRFDPKDMTEALLLVAELKALKAYEERLSYKVGV